MPTYEAMRFERTCDRCGYFFEGIQLTVQFRDESLWRVLCPNCGKLFKGAVAAEFPPELTVWFRRLLTSADEARWDERMMLYVVRECYLKNKQVLDRADVERRILLAQMTGKLHLMVPTEHRAHEHSTTRTFDAWVESSGFGAFLDRVRASRIVAFFDRGVGLQALIALSLILFAILSLAFLPVVLVSKNQPEWVSTFREAVPGGAAVLVVVPIAVSLTSFAAVFLFVAAVSRPRQAMLKDDSRCASDGSPEGEMFGIDPHTKKTYEGSRLQEWRAAKARFQLYPSPPYCWFCTTEPPEVAEEAHKVISS